MLQITGNGATSSARNEPGFGKVGEAKSGVVHVTGFPDGPPVHTGFSHADTVTALMGAFAISASLTNRNDPDFDGEWIDLSLFESLFRLVEWQIIVYDQLGMIPMRAGNQLAVAPGAVINTFLSQDDVWITVTSGTPRSVRNIAEMLGEDLSRYEAVADQLNHASRLDGLLHDWIRARTADECLKTMAELEVVGSRIFNAEDIVNDPVYLEREDVILVNDPELGEVRMQGVIPKLHHRPGSVRRTGPTLGEDNDHVYRTILGKSETDLDRLRREKVI
jgi:formyl-CoA transferase